MRETNKARKWLRISFALLFSRVFFTCLTGISGHVVPVLPTILFMAALPAALLAGREYAKTEYVTKGNFFLFSVLLLVMLLARGILGNAISFIAWQEFFVFLLTLVFLYVGQFDRAWHDISSFLWALCLALAVLAIISLNYGSFAVNFDLGVTSFDASRSNRWATATLSYQVNWSLALWPIILAFAVQKRKLNYMVLASYFVFGTFLFLQVWFQKRAPSTRGLSYLLCCFIILVITHQRPPMHLVVFTVICILLGVGWIAKTENFGFLLERFQSEDLREGGGRTYELGEMLAGFSIKDWLVGRGLGGYFFIENWSAGMVEVTETRQIGRHILHLGFFYPLLKGGLLFTFFYFWFAIKAFLPKGRIWMANPYNIVAWIVMPVYVLFLFAEGPPTYSNPLDAVLFGLCCGRLIDCTGRREQIRAVDCAAGRGLVRR